MITLLFILRLVSALAIISFFGVIIWIMIREMEFTKESLAAKQELFGHLAVTETECEALHIEQMFPLRMITGIGRGQINAIVLPDEYASMEHVLLTFKGKQWWLEDLNSKNGTLLNGLLVSEPVVITTGDMISIGTTSFRLEIF